MKLYSLRQIAKIKHKDIKTVANRARDRMIKPYRKEGTKSYFYSQEQMDAMFADYVGVATKGVVYVTQTFEIYHSKMNFQAE